MRFIPDEGFSGPDGFALLVSDGFDTIEAEIAVAVASAPDDPQQAPVAGTFATPLAIDESQVPPQDEDAPRLSVDVLSAGGGGIAPDAPATDADGDALFIVPGSLAVDPAAGTATIRNGEILFTPAQYFNGAATIAYAITDADPAAGGGGRIANGTLPVAVNAVESQPVASDGTVGATAGDDPITFNVPDFVFDPDAGDALLVTGVTVTDVVGSAGASPQAFNVALDPLTGQAVVTPPAGLGAAMVTLADRVTEDFDPNAIEAAVGEVEGTVTVTIEADDDGGGETGGNHAPVVLATAPLDAGTVNEDAVAVPVLEVGTVLAAFADPGGDPVAFVPEGDAPGGGIVVATGSAGGRLVLPAAGPSPGAPGSEADSDDTSAGATPVDGTPTGGGEAVGAPGGGAPNGGEATVDPDTGNDPFGGGPAVGGPVGGDPVGGDPVGDVTTPLLYTAPADLNGIETFTLTVADPSGLEASVSATLAVASVNDAPTAGPFAAATDEDTPITVTIDDLRAAGFEGPANGSVAIDGEAVVYTPDAGFLGEDACTFTVSDGNGGEARATVTVTVEAEADDQPPVAADDTVNGTEDEALTLPFETLLANDTAAGPLAIESVGDAIGGRVRIEGEAVTFEPRADLAGEASFRYTASDGTGNATATVTVLLAGRNDAPGAADDRAETTAGVPVTIDVLASDADPDGEPVGLVPGGVADPQNGTAAIVGGDALVGPDGAMLIRGGEIRYTPDASFSGVETFTYEIADGNGGTASGTVAITVEPGAPPEPAGLVIDGTPGRDVLVGGAGEDTLTGFGGLDIVDGGAGEADVAVLSGGRGGYPVLPWFGGAFDVVTIDVNPFNGFDGIDLYDDVEFFRFADRTASLDELLA